MKSYNSRPNVLIRIEQNQHYSRHTAFISHSPIETVPVPLFVINTLDIYPVQLTLFMFDLMNEQSAMKMLIGDWLLENARECMRPS